MLPSRQVRRDNADGECEITVKRDRQGRITGMKTRGKCTKEDRMIFAQENHIDPDDVDID